MKSIPDILFKHKDSNPINGFEMIDLEQLMKLPIPDHSPANPHRVNFFTIMMIEKGSVNHQLDFKEYELKAGQCLFISNGQVQSFSEHQEYHGKLILFTDSFLHKHFTADCIARISVLYNYFISSALIDQQEQNIWLVNKIKEVLEDDNTAIAENLIGAYLSIYLLKTQSKTNDLLMDRNLELFIQFKKELQQRFHHSRDVKFFVELLHVDYKRLNNASKATTGKTAKAIIDEFVILEAKRRLASTNLSVKEIAYQCGFEEPTNFLKFFKKHSSTTPNGFRKLSNPR